MVLTYLTSDAHLPTVAVGGIYTYTGFAREGLNRETYPAAFNNGYVLPLIVIKARGAIPTLDVTDELEQRISFNQVIEFWLYQWEGYDIIDDMDHSIYRLMQGHKFSGYTPASWDYTTPPLEDMGSLKGSSMRRVDYMLRKVREVRVV